MSKECNECLKGINKQHQIDLDFERDQIFKKVKKIIDDWAYKNHIYMYKDYGGDINDNSEAFSNHLEVKDIDNLKQQLKELEKK